MSFARRLACVVLIVLAGRALAQDAADFPNRLIRVIVPVGAGAGVDIAARLTAAAAEPHLGGKFIIENKPGASMRVGTSQAAKAAPDGYTLLFAPPAPIVASQFIPPKLDFDPAKDFRPLVIGVFQPVLLVVRPSLGMKSLDEFIGYAKHNPGKLSFGIQGVGGEMHLTLMHFMKTAGMAVTPVPYNSGAQAITDLLADRLDAMFLVIPPIKQHIESGKLVALATLNARRVQALPNIPTMAELGRPEMTNAIWFGYLAPAKIPDAAFNKLTKAFEALKSDTALAARVSQMGAELSMATTTEFQNIIAADRARYGKIVAESDLAKQN